MQNEIRSDFERFQKQQKVDSIAAMTYLSHSRMKEDADEEI